MHSDSSKNTDNLKIKKKIKLHGFTGQHTIININEIIILSVNVK